MLESACCTSNADHDWLWVLGVGLLMGMLMGMHWLPGKHLPMSPRTPGHVPTPVCGLPVGVTPCCQAKAPEPVAQLPHVRAEQVVDLVVFQVAPRLSSWVVGLL